MPFATSLRLGLVIARESGKGVPDRREGGALRHLGAACTRRQSDLGTLVMARPCPRSHFGAMCRVDTPGVLDNI
jgi:hypothetical protein